MPKNKDPGDESKPTGGIKKKAIVAAATVTVGTLAYHLSQSLHGGRDATNLSATTHNLRGQSAASPELPDQRRPELILPPFDSLLQTGTYTEDNYRIRKVNEAGFAGTLMLNEETKDVYGVLKRDGIVYTIIKNVTTSDKAPQMASQIIPAPEPAKITDRRELAATNSEPLPNGPFIFQHNLAITPTAAQKFGNSTSDLASLHKLVLSFVNDAMQDSGLDISFTANNASVGTTTTPGQGVMTYAATLAKDPGKFFTLICTQEELQAMGGAQSTLGVAYMPQTFINADVGNLQQALISVITTTDLSVIAHEMGHNLGAQHNFAQASFDKSFTENSRFTNNFGVTSDASAVLSTGDQIWPVFGDRMSYVRCSIERYSGGVEAKLNGNYCGYNFNDVSFGSWMSDLTTTMRILAQELQAALIKNELDAGSQGRQLGALANTARQATEKPTRQSTAKPTTRPSSKAPSQAPSKTPTNQPTTSALNNCPLSVKSFLSEVQIYNSYLSHVGNNNCIQFTIGAELNKDGGGSLPLQFKRGDGSEIDIDLPNIMEANDKVEIRFINQGHAFVSILRPTDSDPNQYNIQHIHHVDAANLTQTLTGDVRIPANSFNNELSNIQCNGMPINSVVENYFIPIPAPDESLGPIMGGAAGAIVLGLAGCGVWQFLTTRQRDTQSQAKTTTLTPHSPSPNGRRI